LAAAAVAAAAGLPRRHASRPLFRVGLKSESMSGGQMGMADTARHVERMPQNSTNQGSTRASMTRRPISTKPHRSGGTPLDLCSGSPTTIPEFEREVTWLEVEWHVNVLLLEGPGAHGRWCCRRRVRRPSTTTVAQPPSRSPVGVGAAGTAGTFVSPTCSSSRSSFAPPVERECGRRLSVTLSWTQVAEA